MKKRFNTTGVCVSRKHYMVDINNKLREIEKLIENEFYFTVNRPRQYGKTTTFNSHGVHIIVVNDDEDKSPQQELIEDLMSIITSFSGKLYGLRSRKNKVVEEKIKEVVIDALHLQNKNNSKSNDASNERGGVSK